VLATPPRFGAATATNAPAGTVEFVSYEPKRVVLQAQAATPAVLLLNDKFDPQWSVTVDGRPEALLRANFLMRGVPLEPGTHTIEFRFRIPSWPLVVSLVALAAALGCLALAWRERPRDATGPAA
jgi:hypothetical protein